VRFDQIMAKFGSATSEAIPVRVGRIDYSGFDEPVFWLPRRWLELERCHKAGGATGDELALASRPTNKLGMISSTARMEPRSLRSARELKMP
jgi:hypothetical protein